MLTHLTLAQLLAPDRLVPGRRRDVDVLLAWGRRPSALRVEPPPSTEKACMGLEARVIETCATRATDILHFSSARA